MRIISSSYYGIPNISYVSYPGGGVLTDLGGIFWFPGSTNESYSCRWDRQSTLGWWRHITDTIHLIPVWNVIIPIHILLFWYHHRNIIVVIMGYESIVIFRIDVIRDLSYWYIPFVG